MFVIARLQEGAQDPEIDIHHLVLDDLRHVSLEDRPQDDRPAQDEERIPAGAFLRIGSQDIQETSQPADEIRQFCSPFLFLGQLGAKFIHAMAGTAGKNKYAAPDGVYKLAFLEGAILHGRQEVSQPSQGLAVQGGVEFVPEHQRDLPGSGQHLSPGEAHRTDPRAVRIGTN